MPADRHKQSSKYTADRGMPGAFEGETVTRRRFMEVVTHGAGGIAAAALHAAGAGLRARPDLQARAVRVADHRHARRLHRADLRDQGADDRRGHRRGRQVDRLRAQARPADRHRAADQVQRLRAQLSRSPRAACTSAARSATSRPPSASSARATAASTTSAARSPAARRCARSTASTRSEHDGYVYIGPRYSVNSELERFSPRDPGEPLDGIGQYLYPSRFDTSVLPSTNNLPLPPTVPGTTT